MASISIHISDVKTFRQCRRKWGWSSALRENLEPIIPYAPFFTGRAVHDSLEQYYLHDTDLFLALQQYLDKELAEIAKLELWPSEQQKVDEQIELIEAVLTHYTLWQEFDRKNYSDRNLEFLAMEVPFEIPLLDPKGREVPGFTLGGRFDGWVRNKTTGEYWIWEAKTTRSVSELLRSLALDEQSSLYLHAAEIHFGIKPEGILYNVMRKKGPTKPVILKNGGLSRAKNMDTTSFAYLDTVMEAFNWTRETALEEYSHTVAQYEENEAKFFKRFPLRKTRQVIDSVLEGLYYTALEMTNPDITLYSAPGWLSCNFCLFKSVCIAQNAGGNYRDILNLEFQKRKSNTSDRTKKE